MNAPYDGDRGETPGGSPPPDDPYAQPDAPQDPDRQQQDDYGQDPYGHRSYPQNPYGEDPYGQRQQGQQAPGPYEPDPYGAGGQPGQGGYPPDAYPQAPQAPYAAEPHRPDAYPSDPYGPGSYPPDPYLDQGQSQGQLHGHGQGQSQYQSPGHTPPQDPRVDPRIDPHLDPRVDPLTDPRYDRPRQPPPPAQPGGYPDPSAPHQQSAAHPPDPRQWAPEPEWPTQYMQYGSDPSTIQFNGINDLLSQPPSPGYGQVSGPPANHDPFAHLFRDQQPYHPPQQGGPQGQADQQGYQSYQGQQSHQSQFAQQPDAAPQPAHGGPGGPPRQPPAAPGAPAPAAAPQPRSGGGKAAGLLRSSAIMAAGTLVSRLTGFVRSALIVVALGATPLGETYQLAIVLPTMLYVLTVGGGLNSVFVPQLVRAMKEDRDGGQAYANRLLTLVAVLLGLLTLAAIFFAPQLLRLMSVKLASDPEASQVAVTFIRFCLPSIFFMGIHVVMGQILNARGRFGAMMWTPVLNNVVIIFTISLFLAVYGSASTSGLDVKTIPPEGVRLLGMGTLLGLVVQSLAMIPYLRAAGFRIRPRFDWRGHGLGKAAKLAKWTVLFVLANQAGVLIVTQLSTWAGSEAYDNGHPGTNYIAYSNAQLIWTMPHSIITVSVMAALLPRLARSANDGDNGAVRDDISQGLRNSAVAMVPIAFGFVALGIPMCTLIYGGGGTEAAQSMGYMLMAFGLGLIPYSVQYVVLRAFYAYEDTRTPFYNTVIVAAVNGAGAGISFLVLPARWAVVGMAAAYGLAFIIGVRIAWRRLRTKLGGDLDGARVIRTYARLSGASVPAALASGGTAYVVTQQLGSGMVGSACALLAGGLVLAVVFVFTAKRMRVQEINAMVGMVRARLGR